jgi:RNA polymerase sigma-70 factor (ECF subfamily)
MSITVDLSGGGEARPTRGLDADAFGALYARHRDALHRYCLTKTKDRTLVEDIVQDVFEKAFARRDSFDPEREFWPWLASIAANACIDAHRRSVSAGARYHRYAQDTYREPFDVTSANVLRRFEQRRLGEFLSALPVRQRAALGLFALDGLSYEQIAGHLGYSVATVKALIRRARCTLREAAARWVGVTVGAVRGARRHVHRRIVGTSGPLWPSWQGFGVSGATALSAIPNSTMVVMAAVLSVLAPVGAGATGGSSATIGGSSLAVVQVRTADEGGAGSGGNAPSSRPPLQALTGTAERAGNEAVASLVADEPAHGDPETIRAESFAMSPDYENDRTIFLAGGLTVDRFVPSVPLVVTHDGGASWTRRRAVGLGPVVKLVLPPAYPRDSRLFAVTLKGLQVSYDGGDTFETVAAVPQITDVAVSPRFDGGDPTILMVAGERLLQYRDDTGATTGVVIDGELAPHLFLSVAHAGDGTVLVGTRLPEPVYGNPRMHVSRCSRGLMLGALPRLECSPVRLPFIAATQLPVYTSPFFRPGLFFVPVPMYPFVSGDGGRTFAPARESRAVSIPMIEEMAGVPSAQGESAVVAQSLGDGSQLARTDDAGRTWRTTTIDLPDFAGARRVIVTPTGRIIVGSYWRGIACSDDGRTWTRTCATPDAA